MKATPAFVTVSILLGCSVLLNAVLLLRPEDPEPTRRAPLPARSESLPAPAAPASLPAAEPAPPSEPLRKTPEPTGKSVAAAPARSVSVKDDPAVAAVIDAQRSFKAFWDDLDQLFKAKSRLDDQKVFESALRTTMDYLEIPETTRTAFVEAARGGAAAVALAKSEEDAAKQALPPKDKNDPGGAAAIDQQKKAIDARYKERVKAAVDGVRSRLDLQNPRHVEFASNAEKWLRNLVPKQL
jgi:hypothetical protein